MGLSLAVSSPLAAIMGTVSVIVIVCNIFVILVILRTPVLRNISGYMMVSLAAADLGVGVNTAVPLIYATFSNTLSKSACDAMGFLNSVAWVASVYTMSMLMLDRYLAVSRPLHYKMLMTNRRGVLVIIITWTLSCLLWFLPLVGIGGYKFNEDEIACYFNVGGYPRMWITYMFIIFLPAVCVICFTSFRMWMISRRHLVQIQSAMPDASFQASKKNMKATKTLLIIVAGFYVSWTPFVVEHIVKACMGKLEQVPEWLEIAIYVLAIANSFWNPIIYVASNGKFRKATINQLTCKKNRVQPLQDSSH